MTFDKAVFLSIYPQFAEVPDAALNFCWQNAILISGLETNTDYSDADKQNLAYMLMCHMLTLNARGTAAAMTNATEGSVSVSFAAPATGKEEDWYMLTPCGAAYWQAIKGGKFGGMWFVGCHC